MVNGPRPNETPRICEALSDAGKPGRITVIAFDEDPIALGAVKEGSFARGGTASGKIQTYGSTAARTPGISSARG